MRAVDRAGNLFPPPRSWPETVDLARRVGVPAARFRDHDVVDEHWPPRWVDGELVRGGGER